MGRGITLATQLTHITPAPGPWGLAVPGSNTEINYVIYSIVLKKYREVDIEVN